MFEWLDSVAGPAYTAALLWTLAALILLIIVLVIVKLVRSLTFGTFVAGGRNRKTRLAVMDATAVDSHRRLVLVRRDDIEHLLLIGGPTDVVVETDIRMAAPRRPALTGETAPHEAPQPPRPHAQHAPSRPAAPHQAKAPAAPAAPMMHRPSTAPAAHLAPHAAPAAAARPQPGPVAPARPAPLPAAAPVRREQIDETLMKELEVSLDDKPRAGKPAVDPSLDDEMARLLGELSSHKK
ncbi:flagellar biosynthetic protein FliO [Mesorhizobium sp. CC13]|uniref:hypothetical protein n=1 Tax=Mesorhizobium sp. CC13 TaxID=3029194 RepID=UPI003267BC96